MMPSESIHCALEKCQCVVTAPIAGASGDPQPAYCSEICLESETREEETNCPCGHPACDTP